MSGRRQASGIVCTLGVGDHVGLLATSRPSLERWTDRHGYALDVRTTLAAPERAASWNKVLQMRQAIEDHDVAFWIDADAVVVDTSHDMTGLVSRQNPLGLVAHTYAGQTVPNLGVFALRSTRSSRRLLDRLWTMEQYLDHKWWENAALLELLGYDISSEPIRKLRRTRTDRLVNEIDLAWNSIDLVPSPSPIIKHYPGTPNDERARRIAEDIADWEARGRP